MPYSDPRTPRTSRLYTVYKIAEKAAKRVLASLNTRNVGQGTRYGLVDSEDDDTTTGTPITATAPLEAVGDVVDGYNIAISTTGAASGDVLTFDGADWSPEPIPEGDTTFLGLTDTPDSYVGQGTKFVCVGAGELGLEFAYLPDCELTETSGALNFTTAGDVMALESTTIDKSTLSVERDEVTGVLDAPLVTITCKNAGDKQNIVYISGAGSGYGLYVYQSAEDVTCIKGACTAVGSVGVSGIGGVCGVSGAHAVEANDSYGGSFTRTNIGEWGDIEESVNSPLAAPPEAGHIRFIADANHHTFAITSDALCYDLGNKPESFHLMIDNNGTDVVETNFKTQAHATYGGSNGMTNTHVAAYSFTNHEVNSDYTSLLALMGVTINKYGVATWTFSTQTVFWIPFTRTTDSVTVVARIKRSGTTAADAYHRVYLILSDQTGANSTNTNKLMSAVGTDWEEISVGPIDVSGYETQLEVALELSTDRVPAATTNAISTLFVHSITIVPL